MILNHTVRSVVRDVVSTRAFLAGGLALLLLAPGCASKPKAADPSGKGLSKTDEQIFLGDTIERNYDPHVIIKRAEAFFDREEYPEAVVELQHFLELHRSHRLAAYAQFRLAEAIGRQAKTVDRDPEPVMKAEAMFHKLRSDFPSSRWDGQALDRIRECQEWLAKTHLFVGQFYQRRGAFLAAAHRFEAVLRDYPDMKVAPEAQFLLAKAYESLGANDWAREQLTLLDQRYPASDVREEAGKMLARLGGPVSNGAVALASAQGTSGSGGQSGQIASAVPSTSAGAALASAATLPASPESSATLQSARSTTAARAPGASGLTASPTFCRLGVWC